MYNAKFRAELIKRGADPAVIDAEEQRELERQRAAGIARPKREPRFDPDPNAEERSIIEGASFRPRP